MKLTIVMCACAALGGCSTALPITPLDGALDQAAAADGAVSDGSPSPDLASTVDVVPCAPGSCATGGGNLCCAGPGANTCQPPPCAPSSFLSLSCDGPEDCHGQQCCYHTATSVISCAASCTNNDIRLCHVPSDCNPGECCLQLEASAPVSGCVTVSTGC